MVIYRVALICFTFFYVSPANAQAGLEYSGALSISPPIAGHLQRKLSNVAGQIPDLDGGTKPPSSNVDTSPGQSKDHKNAPLKPLNF